MPTLQGHKNPPDSSDVKNMQKIENTSLWSQTLSEKLPGRRKRPELEQTFVSRLRQSFIQFRDRTSQLVDQIESSFRDLTVHNMVHIDALWEAASLLTGDKSDLNPLESYVLGGAFLLHDAGLALASYPCGLDEIHQNPLWRDAVAQRFMQLHGRAIRTEEFANLPEDVSSDALETFLRLNHAKNAQALGTCGFELSSEDTTLHLIDDSELRLAFGNLVGRIAYSHWWPIEKVVSEFSSPIGAFPGGPADWSIDPLKLAILLRVADAIQIDSRRAPAFRRALRKPIGVAELHWQFQQRMLAPVIADGGVLYSSSSPFCLAEADAWWVGQELLHLADSELRAADAVLQQSGRQRLAANHVVGAYDPRQLSRIVQVTGWSPVSTRLHVSNVAQLVERLGGKQLYGDDPHVALRELLQNARDAVIARRCKSDFAEDWGEINVELIENDDGQFLSVLDTGVGMSESTLSTALLDFGQSYWQTQSMLYEHPGLAANGFEPTGQFGIGFFSVFLLGDSVKVVTRRPEDGETQTRVLEFQCGVKGRVHIRPASEGETLVQPGTRVLVKLRHDVRKRGGLLGPAVIRTMSRAGRDFQYNKQNQWRLRDLCAWLAPAIDVQIRTIESDEDEVASKAADWLRISATELLSRHFLYCDDGNAPAASLLEEYAAAIRPIVDVGGKAIGRATLVDMALDQRLGYLRNDNSVSEFRAPVSITAGCFRSDEHWNFCGVLLGRPKRASRSRSEPIVFSDPLALAQWATEQAELVIERSDSHEVQCRYAGLIQAVGGYTRELLVFRFRGSRISFDQLCKAKDLPTEIELIQDEWGVRGFPERDLADHQMGVSTGKMRALFDKKHDQDPRDRSRHPFWQQYWPSLWAAAIEAIARAWSVPLDDVLNSSTLSYAAHVPTTSGDGRRGIRFTSDVVRLPG